MVIYTDGASRGNPGPAAAAFIMTDTAGFRLCAKAEFLENATNNIAEYTALLNSLKTVRQMGIKEVQIYSDSELMVRQLNGIYRVKNDKIKVLFEECMSLLINLGSWQIEHIVREKNTQADALANQALDARNDVEVDAEKKVDQTQKHPALKLGVLMSGGGRTLINILEQIKAGKLNAEIAVVISSRSTVKGVERATSAGLDVKIVRKKDFADIESFSAKLEEELTKANVDLVIQAGWLCLWQIPKRYENKVMNIHPALLPSFGGQGMYGHNVHEAVLEAGRKISGCSVHYCTNEYDKGQIIVQRSCEVKDDDDADSLAERVFQQECIAYPEAIRIFAEQMEKQK